MIKVIEPKNEEIEKKKTSSGLFQLRNALLGIQSELEREVDLLIGTIHPNDYIKAKPHPEIIPTPDKLIYNSEKAWYFKLNKNTPLLYSTGKGTHRVFTNEKILYLETDGEEIFNSVVSSITLEKTDLNNYMYLIAATSFKKLDLDTKTNLWMKYQQS